MRYLYKITNKVNSKVYIGQTINPNQRWNNHKYDAKNNPKYYLHKAINKYGVHNFDFDIILTCKTIEDSDYLEKILISQYKSTTRDFGYNLKKGGNCSEHHDETKKLLSEQKTAFYKNRLATLGTKITDEERKKLSDSHKGIVYSKESTLKKILATKGVKRKPMSKETKQKISESKKGSITWNKGNIDFEFEIQNQICEIYKTKTKTINEIALMFNCCSETVTKVLKKHLIHIPYLRITNNKTTFKKRGE